MSDRVIGLDRHSLRSDGWSRHLPIQYRAPYIARTSDIGLVAEIGRLSVSALSAPDREGLGLSTSALRGVDVDLGSRRLVATADNDVADETVAVADNDVASAVAAVDKYR